MRCAVVSLPLVTVFTEILLNSVLTDEAFTCVCHHLHLTLFNLVNLLGQLTRAMYNITPGPEFTILLFAPVVPGREI